MTTAADLDELNGDYLAAGLAWLRRLLEGDQAAVGERWWDDPRFTGDSRLPALEDLAVRLGMSRFETLVLLLAAATELDPWLPGLCAAALGDPRQTAPTAALALSVLPQPAWDLLSPYRPLRYWRLLQMQRAPDAPVTGSPLRVDERIVNYLKGLNELDERLTQWLSPLPDSWGKELVPSHERVVGELTSAWDESPAGDIVPAVELIGPDPRVRRQLAVAAARRAGLHVYELHVSRLPSAAADVEDLVRLLDREDRLLPLMLYVDVVDLLDSSADAVRAVCEQVASPVVVGAIEPYSPLERRIRIVDAARPTVREQEQLWADLLGHTNRELAARLADSFDFDPGTIYDCVAREGGTARTEPRRRLDAAAASRLWDFCRDQSRPGLAALVSRIEPRADWSQLVLAERETSALRLLADQVRGRATVLRTWGLEAAHGRGAGVTALFAGQSGTGKTLAAEVIANDLRLTLCRIDLSGVVSKYIGETERNLRSVFDAAERGGTVLFFDEADALFGKRSEVRDSHDRYANIEVNYLLQRMESYRGLAILATNQRQALDGAFMRRLRMVITFPFPGRSERRRLWELAFPATAPVAGIDVDRLAELPATGGMIRNIALNAACCAAGRSATISMSLVLQMARMEFRKLDIPLPDLHFVDED